MAENRPNKKKTNRAVFMITACCSTVIFLTAFGLVMIYSASSYAAQIEYDGMRPIL